jgi:hypothetical protein
LTRSYAQKLGWKVHGMEGSISRNMSATALQLQTLTYVTEHGDGDEVEVR